MFEVLKYRRQLRKLENQVARMQNSYIELKKKAHGDELAALIAEESSEIVPLFEEIDSIKTRRFRQIANKLMIPLPDYNNKDFWEQRYYGYGQNLTTKGFWELKKLLRQEDRERREGYMVWIAALTGIIGAITGLMAIIMK